MPKNPCQDASTLSCTPATAPSLISTSPMTSTVATTTKDPTTTTSMSAIVTTTTMEPTTTIAATTAMEPIGQSASIYFFFIL